MSKRYTKVDLEEIGQFKEQQVMYPTRRNSKS